MCSSSFTIDDYSNFGYVLVEERETITLYCHVNSNWKTCKWINDKTGAQCFYTYMLVDDGWKVEEHCQGFSTNPKFFGSQRLTIGKENVHCEIQIANANISDSGSWQCELEKCNNRDNNGCKEKSGSGEFCTGRITVGVTFIENRIFLIQKIKLLKYSFIALFLFN